VHIASAFNVPTVAMFTADKATRWSPRADLSRTVVGRGATIDSVELDDAARATAELLDLLYARPRVISHAPELSTSGASS